MMNLPKNRAGWKKFFFSALAATVIYILISTVAGFSNAWDELLKLLLIISLAFSSFKYFSLLGVPEQTGSHDEEKEVEKDQDSQSESDYEFAPIDYSLENNQTADYSQDEEDFLAQLPTEHYDIEDEEAYSSTQNSFVEPTIIEKPVYREVEKEIIVERPVIVEREIIVEKPVYREVEKEIFIERPVHKEITEQSVEKSEKEVEKKTEASVMPEKNPVEKDETENAQQTASEKEPTDSVNPLEALKADLRSVADPEKKKKQEDFFQAEAGQYAEGDEFLGVKLSDLLRYSDEYKDRLSDADIKTLLGSKIHEERLVSIWVLIKRYEVADESEKNAIYDFYIKNRKLANNWDLVDLAARNIVGPELLKTKDVDGVLTSFAASDSLWDKRTSVMATTAFVNSGDIKKSFQVVEKLLTDENELVQSSVGWILKECYKQKPEEVEAFVIKHFSEMSNQSVRIATEKMEKKRRKEFLKGNFEA